MIEVKSYKDRVGNKVIIGNEIGYFNQKGQMLHRGKVRRITKAGYFISIYIEGENHPWYKTQTELVQ